MTLPLSVYTQYAVLSGARGSVVTEILGIEFGYCWSLMSVLYTYAVYVCGSLYRRNCMV